MIYFFLALAHGSVAFLLSILVFFLRMFGSNKFMDGRLGGLIRPSGAVSASISFLYPLFFIQMYIFFFS